jgi:sulfonate transport system ATP-binding protein
VVANAPAAADSLRSGPALWRRHRPAVLLVTHDVDEAILLADRVLVLDGGRIVLDEQVTISRPRSAAYVGFQDLRRMLLA